MSEQMKVSEAFADVAAGEALSSLNAEDSAAYERTLADASADEQRLDRELRETVARMAGGAPFMKPREELRGRILQATAPATFKMEDYRQANRDSRRFYKWGFYAAMAFLAAGAWYNTTLRQDLANAQGHAQQLAAQVSTGREAIADMVNVKSMPIAMQYDGKTVARAYANDQNGVAVVAMPEGMLAQGMVPQLSLDGKKYTTIVVPVPNGTFPDSGKAITDTNLALRQLQPDSQALQPHIAVMGH